MTIGTDGDIPVSNLLSADMVSVGDGGRIGGTGTIDGELVVSDGRFEPRDFCPGFLRGLAFHGNLAYVGPYSAEAEDRITFAA